jgi:hypothetical protein
VNPSSPEEEETKNKKTKNKNSSSPPARSKEPPGTMKRLTEGYAARQGFRPDRWEPIQQGYRLMLDGGYSPERVEECEDRLVALGWTWTINTVRDWMPRFVAGLMPEPGSGRKSGASELMKCSQEPGDPYTELNKLGYEARVRGPGQDENIAAYNALADRLGEPRIELQGVAS